MISLEGTLAGSQAGSSSERWKCFGVLFFKRPSWDLSRPGEGLPAVVSPNLETLQTWPEMRSLSLDSPFACLQGQPSKLAGCVCAGNRSPTQLPSTRLGMFYGQGRQGFSLCSVYSIFTSSQSSKLSGRFTMSETLENVRRYIII